MTDEKKFCEFCDSKGGAHKKECTKPKVAEPQTEAEPVAESDSEVRRKEAQKDGGVEAKLNTMTELLTLVVESQKKSEERLDSLEERKNKKGVVIQDTREDVPPLIKETVKECFFNTYDKIGLELVPFKDTVGFQLTLIIPDELHTPRQIKSDFKETILTVKKDKDGKTIANETQAKVVIIPDRRSITITGAGSKEQVFKFCEKVKGQILYQFEKEKEPAPKF